MIRKLIFSSLASLLLASIFTPIVCVALEPGTKAPVLSLPTRDGSVTSLESLKGKVVYLDFWASWCGPCKRSLPWMAKMQERFQNDGFVVIAVNLDASRNDAEKLLGMETSNIQVLFDAAGGSPEQFGVRTMPTSFLLNRDGEVVSVHEGFHEEDKPQLEHEIESLLKGGAS